MINLLGKYYEVDAARGRLIWFKAGYNLSIPHEIKILSRAIVLGLYFLHTLMFLSSYRGQTRLSYFQNDASSGKLIILVL